MGQEKKQEALGWILAQKGKESILSIDVDLFTLKNVEAYVRQLQKKEDVGTAVIVESSDLHFHIYFFWRFLSWDKIQEIIQNCPIADQLFKSFTKNNMFIRMRISSLYKPFIKIITHDTMNNLDLGDFYFKHYLWMVGFAPETIEHYMIEVKI